MAQLLIVTSAGPEDPTRSSVPFHIALNGAAATGVSCGVALAGDATELLKEEVWSQVTGVGVPTLAALLEGCRREGVSLHV